MVAIVTLHSHQSHQLLPATLSCSVFPFHLWVTRLAAFLQPWTPAGLQACTPIKKPQNVLVLKQPILPCPLGLASIPPPLTTLLPSDIAGVMGSGNILPSARRFRQKQSVNFTGERWVSRPRLSPAISLQSNRFRVRVAHFDIINGVATSVINPSKLLTRWLLSPCLLKKQ